MTKCPIAQTEIAGVECELLLKAPEGSEPEAGWREMGRSSVLIVGTLALLLIGSAAYAGQLYRYINEKGYQEIGYSIPPHLVPNGYDVIDDGGRLIRRVAPQLSEDEYAAKLERDRVADACNKALNRVNRLYQSLDDIDAAQKSYEQKAAQSMQNDQANLELAQSALKGLQESAARYERKGEPIPERDLTQITRRETEIVTLHSQIDARRNEVPLKAEEFDEDRRLFVQRDCTGDQPIAKG